MLFQPRPSIKETVLSLRTRSSDAKLIYLELQRQYPGLPSGYSLDWVKSVLREQWGTQPGGYVRRDCRIA